jgi:AsmA protein
MLDGRFGPLTQKLEIQGYDFMVGIGKTAIRVSGALLGGKLDATLSAPSINSADLPVTLPLTKPVEIRDLHAVAHAPYPLKQGVSAMELADVVDLALKVQTGGSAWMSKGLWWEAMPKSR